MNATPACPPLGTPIPLHTPHAVSVSLPTWADNVDYEEGDPRVVTALRAGYPRFVYPQPVAELFAVCLKRFAIPAVDGPNVQALVLPSRAAAQDCRAFLLRASACGETEETKPASPPPRVRIVECLVNVTPGDPAATRPVSLGVVLHTPSLAARAKHYWQHTGTVVPSRLAARCLEALAKAAAESTGLNGPDPKLAAAKSRARGVAADGDEEAGQFLEERYGRYLPPGFDREAKVILRRRIAGNLVAAADAVARAEGGEVTGTDEEEGVAPRVSEDDVYLYPTGMNAIYHAYRACVAVRPGARTVQFGYVRYEYNVMVQPLTCAPALRFPYLDTLKIQEKFCPEGTPPCVFLGHGDDADLARLADLAATGPPIAAVFCEFPSNPLLKSPPLSALRALADQHGFLLVVDETIGNLVNVNVLPLADVVVSSLTKVFSGDSNVMGGSAVVNPASRFAGALHAALKSAHDEAAFWAEDAIYLERNSRTFVARVHRINKTAVSLVDTLAAHPAVRAVHYPSRSATRAHYDAVRTPNGGYGGLVSVELRGSRRAAAAFFDALQVYKGPSLGTNFTLACPYTLLAHYGELDWAETFGVSRWLVRVSVGLEDEEVLRGLFVRALDEAMAFVGDEDGQ
ncbi:Cystathionine gamma-synthase [Blastocladiella emersonii ATCC 22665]|nr:Cystathionine gamma-synthase [Blastocladiella emersonii ATCC 22665]